jgi:hypothetical protein
MFVLLMIVIFPSLTLFSRCSNAFLRHTSEGGEIYFMTCQHFLIHLCCNSLFKQQKWFPVSLVVIYFITLRPFRQCRASNMVRYKDFSLKDNMRRSVDTYFWVLLYSLIRSGLVMMENMALRAKLNFVNCERNEFLDKNYQLKQRSQVPKYH